MNTILKKAMRGAAVLLGLLISVTGSPQAATKIMTVEAYGSWKDTGVPVKAGDTVVVRASRILRLADAISVNSNGEWLYCWNLNWFKKGADALSATPRPVPTAPGGALIFRIGNGTPFFVPRTGGAPGKDYTQQLTLPGWEKIAPNSAEAKKWSDDEIRHGGWAKLPGYTDPSAAFNHGASLTHQFVAPESGVLYVGVNLAATAKSNWGWPAFALSVSGKKSADCQVTGRVIDDTGRAVAEAEVQIGAEKKLTASDGSFTFIIAKDGNYTLAAAKENLLPAQKALVVAIDKLDYMDLGAIMLRSKPGAISGKAITEDGKPAAGAYIYAGGGSATAAQDGSFTFSANKGVHILRASKNMANGMPASTEKENVEVVPAKTTQVGTIVLAQAISKVAWVYSNRYVQKGQILSVRASGEINWNGLRIKPEGYNKSGGTFMPGAPWGALVGRIGAGKPFLVGPAARLTAVDTGSLMFAINLTAGAKISGGFNFNELNVLSLGNIEGQVLGAGNKPLAMATVELAGLEGRFETDLNGRFSAKDIPAGRYYAVSVKFPGYNIYRSNALVPIGGTAAVRAQLVTAPVAGSVYIKLLPKSGSTGGLIPVFVEVVNTSSFYGLWGGFQVSLKAKHIATGKEYPGMSPTYMVLAPGERKGTELLCQLPASASAGDYYITAELRVPENVAIENAAKEFEAKKQLEDKLAALGKVSGRLAGQYTSRLNVVKGFDDAKVAQVAQAAKVLVPTITPKVFSPSKGQIVTGNIALREKSVLVMGKELEIFKDKNGEPLVIWNSYQGLYLNAREDGARKDDWVWIGQSNDQSSDFTVNWDTSKFKDGDYLIRATMKTVYDGKPIEGSMDVMVKVRNDPRTGVIRGKVTDENGAPLPYVDVKRLARGQAIKGMDWQSLGTQSEVEWQPEDVTKTNYNGDYAFGGVMSGEHKLQFSMEKYATVTKDLVLAPAQAAVAPTAVLEGEKCRLTGSVKIDDNGALAGVQFDLAGPTRVTGVLNPDGAFAFEGLKKGAYRFMAAKRDYEAVSADFTCAPGEAKALPVLLLRRSMYQVSGLVKDPAGKGIAGVTVTLDRGAGTVTGEEGRFNIWNVPGGSHDLAFGKAGWQPSAVQFTAAASSGPARVSYVEAVLTPAKVALGGKVAPASAQVFVDGAELRPDASGRFETLVDAGEHAVKALKEKFDTFEQKVAVKAGEPRTLEIALAPSKGRLAVTLEPASAALLVDGVAVALSGNKYEADLTPGDHYVQAQKERFDSFERKVTVAAAETSALEIKLAQSKGTLSLTVEPASSEVLIDGAAVNLHGNKYEGAMAPGEHSVKVSKDKFDTFEETLTVPAGGQLSRDIKLANSKGRLAGTVEPADAEFLVDGAPAQLNGGKFEAALQPGDHTIAAAKEMFEPYSGKVTVKSGETAAFEIKLADGYDRNGYNKDGYDRDGFDKAGFSKAGFDKAGFDKAGFDKDGYDKAGFNKDGFDKTGYDKAGFDKDGYDQAGFDKSGFDKTGFNKEGYDKSGFNKEGYDKSGFDKAGFDKAGFDKAGFDKDGYDKAGYNKDGFDKNGYDKAGFNKDGYDKTGYDKAGFDKDGYDKAGFGKDGFDKSGFDKEGYDKAGYNKEGYDRGGYNKAGYDKSGFDKAGYDKDGYDKTGYDKSGFDRSGFDKEGYDKPGFNKEGYDRNGFNKAGFDRAGYDKSGYDKDGYDKTGYNKPGFDRNGYDKAGYDKDGYDKAGFGKEGYDRNGFNKAGFDRAGYDKSGYDKDGYDKTGFDKSGFDKAGFNKEGYDKSGFNKEGYDRGGLNKAGFDKSGYDKAGFDKDGYDKSGFNKEGYDKSGFNKEGYDRSGFDKDGYDKPGFNKEGYDRNGFNKAGFDRGGFDKSGYDKDGYDKAGYNKPGFDRNGYDKAGYDKDGYDKAGFGKEGYDRNGFNKAGFDRAGFDKSGYDKDGYDKTGFDKSGFDKAGFNKEGYDKSGFNKEGYDKAGFDKDGYDKTGFNKEGYDRNGFNKAGFDRGGYDKAGYDKAGFNKEGYDKSGFNKEGYDRSGFDKDGYDRAGFNKEGFDRNGYNKAGFDRGGFDKSGFDKDGYDKSGYNKAGFDRAGFDKSGFDKNGFDKAGFDKAGFNKDGYDRNGYNKAGFDKSGFDKSGFNASGLDRNGNPKGGKPPTAGPAVAPPPPAKAALALTAAPERANIGEYITLDVQTPEPNTEVELSVENGLFEDTDKSVLSARTSSKGKYQVRWASLTPARHRITLKAGKGGVLGQKYAEVTLDNQVPEVDAVLRAVRGSFAVGASLVVELQVKNTGKVNGKYRVEAELRGRTGYPVVPLRPMELQLSTGQTKIAKYDWTIGAIGEYTAKVRIYLVGDKGRLQLVKTYEAALKYTKPALPVKK